MGEINVPPRKAEIIFSGSEPVKPDRPPPAEPPPSPQRAAVDSGQAEVLKLSSTAKSLGPRETLEERRAYILEQLNTTIMPLKVKEEILKKLDAARKDGTLKPLIQELARPATEGTESRLKILFNKMGTPASQGINDLIIMALSGGATVYDEWKRDKRSAFLGILQAGKIDPQIIRELQVKKI